MGMEAGLVRVLVVMSLFSSAGAVYRTPNFVVDAPTQSIAKQVGDAAEQYRDELAVEWLGKRLPGDWAKPCTVRVKVGQIGAGGATTFSFDRGHVFGWKMQVQGSLERILDSVLPHEISHTIFASHFRRPLPRWADEGAATLVEHESEKRRQQLTLKQVFNTPRRIPLKELFALEEYPSQMQDVLTLYAEGYSLTDFLVQRGGRIRFLKFLEDAHRKGWNHALKRYYEFDSIESLETQWNAWVMAGSPELYPPDERYFADNVSARVKQPSAANVTIRAQNPEATAIAQMERTLPGRTRSSSRNRERQLSAPDPRNVSSKRKRDMRDSENERNPLPLSVATAVTGGDRLGPTAGRLRALEDGWIPVTRRRRSATGSLASRLSKNRELPTTDLRVGNDHATSLPFSNESSAGKTDMLGIRNASPRRSENWSGFPRPRTENSSASLGMSSGNAFSPR